MSLDTPNVYTPKYEKQDEDDRDTRELKIEINSYFLTIGSFLEESKDLSVTTDKNKDIAELTTLISDIDRAYKTQVLRQYVDIINSYEKAIDLLSA